MFQQFYLDFDNNIYDELRQAQILEDIGYGRNVGNVYLSTSDHVPIVRTTSKYKNPIQRASEIHKIIINKINEQHDINVNNIMVEQYDNSYATMKYHSDQATDLADDSRIFIFVCYENPNKSNRTLAICNKSDNKKYALNMFHNSVTMFDTNINKQFVHKIHREYEDPTKCIILTMRLSKTMVLYTPIPKINGVELRMYKDNENHEFYKLRGRENKETDFTWPQIEYTLSESDLLPPF